MGFRTLSTIKSNDTDAHFRAWINELHTSLTTFGWVQTTDTGQINFATVTRPSGASIYQGYAIYKMGDGLQSTCPVFIRIDFGTGQQVAGNTPSIKLQVTIGGTDGAGNLTGVISNQWTLQGDVSGSTSNIRSAGTSSSFQCAYWVVTDTGFGFAIGRDLDTSGNDTVNGVNIVVWHDRAAGPTFEKWAQFLANVNTGVGVGVLETQWYGPISAQSTQIAGGNTGVGAVRVPFGLLRNPMKTVLVFARTDFTVETTTAVTIYGGSHTFLMLRPSGGGNRTLVAQNADCGVALLWE